MPPLARIAAAWIAGIVAAATFGLGAWPLAAALALTLLAVAVLRRDRVLAVAALLLPAVFALAVVRFEASHPHLADDSVAHYNDGVAMRIRGVVRGEPVLRDTSQRLTVDVREVQVRGEWRDASDGVQAVTGVLPRYEAGDLLEIEGSLETPPDIDGFDYAEYLARRGVVSTIAFPQIDRVGHDHPNAIQSLLADVRGSLSDGLALALPEPHASLAQGVLLGRKAALPDDLQSQLNDTNTSHLVVVSGSNVVLVAAFVTAALAWIAGRRRAMAISIIVVSAYALLVGLSPPVMRATIMGILLIIARVNGRPTNGVVPIMLAAAIMTAIDPLVIRDVSFQLSFAATAGILLLASPISEWVNEWTLRLIHGDSLPYHIRSWFLEPLAVSIAAMIATTPLIASSFGRASLVGLAANMLVVPLFPLILGSSALAAIGGTVPHLHLLLAAPAYYLLAYWTAVTRWLASLPSASVSIGGFTTPWMFAAYGALAVATWWIGRALGRPALRAEIEPPIPLRRLVRISALAVPVAALTVSAGFVFWPSEPARLRVHVLDVGQGDAILIQTPRGDEILVDGGPGPAVLRRLGNELAWHDRSIEMVVLTHPQADHVSGLVDVLDRYDVQRALAVPSSSGTLASEAWLAALDREGVAIEPARAGMTFDLGDGTVMEVLAPDETMLADPEINNRGVVIKITWREISVLLTADIEARAEDALLESGYDLNADVLKVAHHGSRTSSSGAFLDAVSPAISIISAGRDNQYGHPVPEVVARLDDYGSVYVTATAGTVTIETDGTRIWVSHDR